MLMVTRSALPQNYLIAPPILLESFDDSGDWSVISGEGVISSDSVHKKTSAASLKVTTSSTVTVRKLVTMPTYNEYQAVGFWIWIDNAAAITSFMLRVYNTGLITFIGQTWNAAMLRDGWNFIGWSKNDKYNDVYLGHKWGFPSGAVQFAFGSSNGTPVSVSICDLITYGPAICNIVWTMDDTYSGIFTKMFPKLQSLGLVASTYAVSSHVDDNEQWGSCTVEQLQEMYAAGWCIGNHSDTHAIFSDITAAQMQTEIEACNAWLIEHDMPRGVDHFCYPTGANNQLSYDTLTALGVKTATLANRGVGYEGLFYPGYDDNLRIPRSLMLDNTHVFVDYKVGIDKAIAAQCTLFLFGHNVADSPTSSMELATSEMNLIADYIAMLQRGGKCRVITLDEYYEGLTNPRYRSLPVGRA